jgi:HEAT repeat protein
MAMSKARTMNSPARELLVAAVGALLGASCSSAPPAPEKSEAIESEFAEIDKEETATRERQQAFERVLSDTDRMLERYASAITTQGAAKLDRVAVSLEAHLRKSVEQYFDRFMAAAEQRDFPRNRAIALGALGFSGRREALDPLLNGLGDDNAEVVANATFGVAMLKDARTPPEYLARILEGEKFDEGVRAGAAWALLRVQEVVVDPKPIEQIWVRVLERPIDPKEAGVSVSALRGVGAMREERLAPIVERYVSHPTPLVRQAAAVALGRIGARSSYPALIALIGPAEENPNVRLAARKALQALAGDIDRGYDVEEWHRVFERGG